MGVHAPGRVDLGGLGRRRGGLGRAIARALPSSAPLGGGRKKLIASISMTSMIDVLVVMTVFLLLTFQSSPQCALTRDLTIPPAEHVSDMIDAPMVLVTAQGAMLLDGSLVASGDELAFNQGRVARIDGLFNMLRQKHELAKQLHPGQELPGHVILAIDGDVPAHLVKSIVMTAARSGYPSVDFMVHAGKS